MSTHTRLPAAEMSTLKTISIVLAFTAAVGMVLGTAGFSAIDADRGIEVGVVDDEEAYLAVNQTTETVTNDTETEVIEYENRFGTMLTDINVDITAVDPNVSVIVSDSINGIPSGKSRPVNATVDCTSGEPIELTATIEARGSGVDVETTTVLELICE